MAGTATTLPDIERLGLKALIRQLETAAAGRQHERLSAGKLALQRRGEGTAL